MKISSVRPTHAGAVLTVAHEATALPCRDRLLSRCGEKQGSMTVPTMIFVGDKDDWTRASWCQDMMARRDGKGAPVTLAVYPGATHAFNVPAPSREYLGHHLEYDAQATADAWAQVRSFLHERLDGSEAAGHASTLQSVPFVAPDPRGSVR